MLSALNKPLMLSFVMLNIIKLSVVMLNIIKLSVVVQSKQFKLQSPQTQEVWATYS